MNKAQHIFEKYAMDMIRAFRGAGKQIARALSRHWDSKGKYFEAAKRELDVDDLERAVRIVKDIPHSHWATKDHVGVISTGKGHYVFQRNIKSDGELGHLRTMYHKDWDVRKKPGNTYFDLGDIGDLRARHNLGKVPWKQESSGKITQNFSGGAFGDIGNKVKKKGSGKVGGKRNKFKYNPDGTLKPEYQLIKNAVSSEYIQKAQTVFEKLAISNGFIEAAGVTILKQLAKPRMLKIIAQEAVMQKQVLKEVRNLEPAISDFTRRTVRKFLRPNTPVGRIAKSQDIMFSRELPTGASPKLTKMFNKNKQLWNESAVGAGKDLELVNKRVKRLVSRNYVKQFQRVRDKYPDVDDYIISLHNKIDKLKRGF